MNRKPQLETGETLGDYLKRLAAWEDEGEWVPASGGTEVPFTTRSGARLLYCWNKRNGQHAYLDLGTDHFLTNEEASNLLALR